MFTTVRKFLFDKMPNKIIFCCVAGVVLLLPLINCSPAPAIIANKDNPQFQRVQQMFSKIAENRTTPSEKFFWWNPSLITDDPLLTSLCENNVDGNYQNPFNCHEFVMCSGGQVFLWECPWDLIYDPIPDLCVYLPTSRTKENNEKKENKETCPWPSIWQNPADVRCDYLGQRLWWSPLAFPTNPNDRCGSEIFYCLKYFLLGYSECPPGCGYSKAYLACIKYEICDVVDEAFGY